MASAAKVARKSNQKARAFSYVVDLGGGKRHVLGYTTNPQQRLKQHSTGSGAKVTRETPSQSVAFTSHSSAKAAKKAETRKYHQEKNRSGYAKVRGAGNTVRFSNSKR